MYEINKISFLNLEIIKDVRYTGSRTGWVIHYYFQEMAFDQKLIPPSDGKCYARCVRTRTQIDLRVSRQGIGAGARFSASRKAASSAWLYGVTFIGRQCITGFTKVFAFKWPAGFRRTPWSLRDEHLGCIHTYGFTYVHMHISPSR